MEIEAIKGAANRAAAESAFLRAVQDSLPRAAFAEIAQLTSDEIAAWATRWNVHAPCVLEEAQSWCAGGWDADIRVDHTQNPPIPDEWFAELRRMNGLAVEVKLLWSGVDSVMSDGSRREAMGKLKALSPGDPWRRERESYLRDELPSVREARLLEDSNLAPIGADPLRESEARFLERARHHFRGRVIHAQRMGYFAVVSKPHFADHMEWLVRFQLRGESRSDIAKAANVVRQAVDRAIRELAAVLELAVRSDDSGSSFKATK